MSHLFGTSLNFLRAMLSTEPSNSRTFVVGACCVPCGWPMYPPTVAQPESSAFTSRANMKNRCVFAPRPFGRKPAMSAATRTFGGTWLRFLRKYWTLSCCVGAAMGENLSQSPKPRLYVYIHLIGVAPCPVVWYPTDGSHGANALAGQLRNGARPVLSISSIAARPNRYAPLAFVMFALK